jgi:allantoin racemase
VTQAFCDVARTLAPDVGFQGVTGAFGARIVTIEAENVIAGHAALDLVAQHGAGHDAVILAISFDTALDAVQSLLPIPVIAITQAACAAAQRHSKRLGVVFFGEASRSLYQNLIAGYGVIPVGFQAVAITGTADYLAPGAKDAATLRACQRLADLGAEAIVICGAAIVGMAARLQPAVSARLFDGSEAVSACLAAIAVGEQPPLPNRSLGEPRGLSPALTALLRGAPPKAG